MKWTQTIPAKSGYYWFAECYEDTARIIWVECSLGFASTFDMNCYDSSCIFSGQEDYWFSTHPLPTLEW